ncbi:MAG: hypothetical protein CUN55_03045 [Phototrophicales bacterium]|nr:MAG: hypothetical protein CUN55_03045 [Phototrophicales bacterium]
MATNATTWFYQEPETGRPYMISERLTHTFWANRLSGIYFKCTNAEPPYQAVGEWRGITVEVEWEVKKWFALRTPQEERGLITVCSEILGFAPTLSYTDSEGRFITEWYLDETTAKARIQEIQRDTNYTIVRRRSY